MTGLVNAAAAAQILGISRRAVYALAKSGEITCYRFGAAVRFDPDDVSNFKLACRCPAKEKMPTAPITLSEPAGHTGSRLSAYFEKMAQERKRLTAEKRDLRRIALAEAKRQTKE